MTKDMTIEEARAAQDVRTKEYAAEIGFSCDTVDAVATLVANGTPVRLAFVMASGDEQRPVVTIVRVERFGSRMVTAFYNTEADAKFRRSVYANRPDALVAYEVVEA